jgi:hypothetical protein
MDGTLIKSLLVEIDGSTEKLRRALREGGVDLDAFGQKAKQTGAEGARGADVMATKQATAARQIAMATETIARQGKVTGETAKQVVSQASNIAFAFGPHGAMMAAIGISTLAIISMFNRVKTEAAEAARVAADEFKRLEGMDLQSVDRERARLESGSFRLNTDLASTDAATRGRAQEIFRSDRTLAGLQGLSQERARQQAALRAEEERLAPFVATMTLEERAREGAVAQSIREEIAAIERAVEELEKRAPAIRQRWNDAVAEATDRARTESGAARGETTAKNAADFKRSIDRALEQAGDAIAADDSRGIGRLHKVLRDGFEGTREDIEKSFGELFVVATNTGRTADIPILQRARDQALELADLLKQNQDLLAGIETGDLDAQAARSAGRDKSGPNEAAIAELERQRDAARALHRDASRSDRDRAQALALAKTSQQQINALVTAEGKTRAEVLESINAQALAIAQSVDGALQLAAAMGKVSKETTDVLRGLVQIGGSIPGLLGKLELFQKAQAGQAIGKNGKAISEGTALMGVASSALPIIGALATIGSTLFGDSPAERERKRVQRENTRALQELTAMVGSTGIALSGTSLAGAGAQVGSLLGGQAASNSAFGRLEAQRRGLPGIGQNLSNVFDVADLRDSDKLSWKDLAARGFDRRELEAAAEALNITLDGTVGSFRQLQRAIDEMEGKLGEFGDSLQDRQTITNAEIAARGITDPIEKLVARTSPAQALSPIVKELLEGRDLSSAEEREQIRQEIVAIIETMRSGGSALTSEQLGGLQRDELLDALLDIIGGLEEIGGAVAAPSSSLGGISGFRGLTEAAGDRISDYLRAINASARTAETQREHTNALLADQLAVFTLLARAPLAVPAVPFSAAGAGARGAATILIEVNLGGVTVQVLPGDDAVTQGTAVAQAIAARAGEQLYRDIAEALKVTGDLGIPIKVN